jgi:hypothetical protein
LAEFDPTRPYEGEWPAVNPEAQPPRQAVDIPPGSVSNDKLANGISPTKLQGIGAKVYNSAVQGTADGVAEFLEPNTISFDEGAFWDSGDATKLTAPYNGVYLFSGYADFAADVDGDRVGKLCINGAAQVTKSEVSVGAGKSTQVLVSVPIKLNAGDYVQFEVTQTAGGALNVNAGEDDNYLSLIFLFPI